MSKQIAKIPLKDIDSIKVYVNTARKTLAQIKSETGADYIVNAGYFYGTFKPCGVLIVNGVKLVYEWNGEGFGFEGNSIAFGWSNQVPYRNFVSAPPLISAGKPRIPITYPAELGNRRGRTAVGVTSDSLVLYCSKDGTADAKTPESLRDELLAFGCVDAAMYDGGGSSMCDFLGQRIISEGANGRIVHNLILVHLKKKEGEPCMTCREKLVTTALAELGTSAPSGDDKYISWYTKETGEAMPLNAPWCAMFVSWCARAAGICRPLIPPFAGCTTGRNIFKSIGTWRDKAGYTPRRGDLIFYDWNSDPTKLEHVGIVTNVSGGYVHTIEGNTGPGVVAEKKFALSDKCVWGFVCWDACDKASAPTGGTGGGTAGGTGSSIRDIQQGLNAKYSSGLTVDGSFGPASKLALTKATQTEINRSCGGKLTVDGSFGPASKTACPALKKSAAGNMVWLLQSALVVKTYALDLDASFGPAVETALNRFKPTVGLKADGIADGNTFAALLK